MNCTSPVPGQLSEGQILIPGPLLPVQVRVQPNTARRPSLTSVHGASVCDGFDSYEFGPFRLDAAARILLHGGAVVPLPKAIQALVLLVQNRGWILERDEVIDYLWPDNIVEDNNLNQCIFKLRRALEHGDLTYIETVPRRGYRFVAPVKPVEPLGPFRAPWPFYPSRRWMLKGIAGAWVWVYRCPHHALES